MATTPGKTNDYAELASLIYVTFLASNYAKLYNLKVHDVRGPIITLEFWTPVDISDKAIMWAAETLVSVMTGLCLAYTKHALVQSEYLEPLRFVSGSHGSIIVTCILGQHPVDPTLN